MAEQHPLAGGEIVRAVAPGVSGSDPHIVEHPELRRNERAVVPVGDDKNAETGDDDVQGTHERNIIRRLSVRKW
jgi:hypothetical protein